MTAAGVLLLGALAAAPGFKERLRSLSMDVQAFGEGARQAELTLPEREIYALQLAVFDSGERAQSEAQRLQRKGVRCIVWQREKMRIVCGVALSRDALDADAAKGEDAYVIRETLEAVPLRLSCEAAELADVQALLETPDGVLVRLLTGEEPLEDILADVETVCDRASGRHPEHALYTQLAQSLKNWHALMERTMAETDEKDARGYAAVTICTLCRELRRTLTVTVT